ncbi:MAG: cation:proton antiporter [Acetobacteraceae bacterium]
MSWLNFVAVLLFLVAILGVGNHLWIGLPRTIGLLAGALVVSIIIVAAESVLPSMALRDWWQQVLEANDLPHLFLDSILAFMLFAGALHVDMTELRNNKWIVLALATFGVVASTALFASGMWLLSAGEVPFIWCLVLGSILAPTDPIAVSELIRRVGLPSSLQAIIAGESLFNDGVAVVVFTLTLSLATGSGELGHGERIIRDFLIEAFGGVALGAVTGYVAYRAMRLIDEYNLELTISLALVAGTYSLAQALSVSGPLAVVVAGLLIGHQATRFAMSDRTRANLTTFWELIDQLLNAILFLLLGFTLLALDARPPMASLAAEGIGLAVLARLISVGVPTAMIRLPFLQTARGIAVLTWGGLRGGISIALALTLPYSPYRGTLLSVCYAVVVFTILVQGLTMPWVIRRLYGMSDDQAEGRGHRDAG